MLSIVCGEDIQNARHKFHEILEKNKDAGYKIQHVKHNEIEELFKDAPGVIDLFGQQMVYETEFVSKKYKGRTKTTFKEAVQNIATDKSINLISWEGGFSAYDLQTIKKIATVFIEAKPSKSIFELLDNVYPRNLNSFLDILNIVSETSEDVFVYTMLRTHVRKLHLSAEGVIDTKSPPWQRGKIKFQSQKWDKEKLRTFYEKLLNIDISVRTGETTYGYLDSVKLLVCYYLK